MTPSTALTVILVAWGAGLAGWFLGPWAVSGVALGGLLAAVVGSRGPGAIRLGPLAILVVALVCASSGWIARHNQDATRESLIPVGRRTIGARVVHDPVPDRAGWRIVIVPESVEGLGWDGPALLAFGDVDDVAAGDRILVTGVVRQRPLTIRGDPVAGTLAVGSIEIVDRAGGVMGVANALRDRVSATIRPSRSSAAALVSGFLIGDIRLVEQADLEAMRRSGLSHYVAVSGSNVALFLAAWWIVSGPLALTARNRSIVGLVGLIVFVAATRAEPSVVRAATMAGLVLGGRAAGFPIDGWTALGAGVTALVAFDASITADIGFQLSVAATAGVMAGMRLFVARSPRWFWAALGASVSAQAAVTPILLIHFGAVPLVSPLANVLSAPLVTASTAAGLAAVVTGLPFLGALAEVCAAGVVGIAHTAGEWPQIGVFGVLLVVGSGLASFTRARFAVAAVCAVLLIASALPSPPPAVPTLAVLDVGQGDAILVMDPTGFVMLVDTGPDSDALRSALRRNGVRRIDLLVITHGDLDHVGGLEAVPTPRLVWVPQHPDSGIDTVIEWASALGVDVAQVGAGVETDVGALHMSVMGPARRYLSDNDGSIVLQVSAAGGPSVLLAGDIEAVAQRDLPDQIVDIVVVPHHGATTSDLRWLVGVEPDLALISAGVDNSYGHPSPVVLDTLAGAAISVCRTDLDGDLVLTIALPVRPPCERD